MISEIIEKPENLNKFIKKPEILNSFYIKNNKTLIYVQKIYQM